MRDKSQSKCFMPTFENGGYWEYYKDLERQFEDFLESVPYLSGNESTYSFRLANQILAIGAHIDSAFKEIAKYPEFSAKFPEIVNPKTKKGKSREPNITDYYPFSEVYNLPQKTVMFKRLPEREQLVPFQQYVKVGGRIKTPDWWRVYNKVKHSFSDNFGKATLQNTRDALAGAFLLNVIHTPAYIRLLEYRVVTPQATGTGAAVYTLNEGWKEKIKDWIKKGKRYGFVETPLFSYRYQH
jgi:hypothetical protein